MDPPTVPPSHPDKNAPEAAHDTIDMSQAMSAVPSAEPPSVDVRELLEHNLASDGDELAKRVGLGREALDELIHSAMRTGNFLFHDQDYDDYLSSLEDIDSALALEGAEPLYTKIYRHMEDNDGGFSFEVLDSFSSSPTKITNLRMAIHRFKPKFDRALSAWEVAQHSWLIMLRVMYLTKLEAEKKMNDQDPESTLSGETAATAGDALDIVANETPAKKRRGRPAKVDSTRPSSQPSDKQSSSPRRSPRHINEQSGNSTITQSRGRGRPRKSKRASFAKKKTHAATGIGKYHGRGRPRGSRVVNGKVVTPADGHD